MSRLSRTSAPGDHIPSGSSVWGDKVPIKNFVWSDQILVDTSVWMEHLKNRNRSLVTLLEAGRVLCHPFIVGEVSSLSLRHQSEILDRLKRLPQTGMATHNEVLTLIEIHGLRGEGLSWIDLHLLASVLLSTCYLWTLDPLLHASAHMLNVSV